MEGTLGGHCDPSGLNAAGQHDLPLCPSTPPRAVCSRNEEEMKAAAGTLDGIVDTVSAKHDLGAYLSLLKTNGGWQLRRSFRQDNQSFSMRQVKCTRLGVIEETVAALQHSACELWGGGRMEVGVWACKARGPACPCSRPAVCVC